MNMSRRFLLAGSAAAAAASVGGRQGWMAAQEGTPQPVGEAPGYALARVRTVPSAELNAAIFPDVMRHFLPATAAVPGFEGYLFAFDNADPATSITLTLVADEQAAVAAEDVAAGYVSQLASRFDVSTPLSENGPVRIFALAPTPAAELPPFLQGTTLRMRNQTNAPDFDLEAGVEIARETLVPVFLGLPGFIMYCWFERDGGRLVTELWESPEAMEAGAEALAAWRDEHFDTSTASETTEAVGTIGYAELAQLG